MRFLLSLVALLLLASSALCGVHSKLPLLRSKLVHRASGNPSAWKQAAEVDDAHPVRLAFAIKQKNLDLVDNLLRTISDPRSPSYGDFLSFEELTALTANAEGTAAVEKYLKKHGARHIEKTRTGDYVKATVTAKQAASLFGARVFHFQHAENAAVSVQRALSYAVPAELGAHTDFIGYLSHFPTLRRGGVLGRQEASQVQTPGNVFPSVLFKYYNIDSNQVTGTAATQSCFEAGQWISNDDLNAFQRQYGLPQQNLARIVGPNFPGNCSSDLNTCIESTLDFEYIMAVASGAPTSYIAVDNDSPQPFLDYTLLLSNDPNAPLVNSISYGEVEQAADPAVVRRFSTEAQKLGLRGITLVVASGDDGVANFPARDDLSKCGFFPSYPASVPFVTAVGATQGPEQAIPGPEVAETSDGGGDITTGGGFSTLFSAPSYQADFVAGFLNSSQALPPLSQFASGGRGYPDVALLGHAYETVDGGQSITGSGTSASAPVFAGMLTLINSARLAAGKSAVGFVNPALYHLAATQPAIFRDVTEGKNNCVAGDGSKCCPSGFTAQRGWDATSGLGSVDFAALKKAFLQLP